MSGLCLCFYLEQLNSNLVFLFSSLGVSRDDKASMMTDTKRNTKTLETKFLISLSLPKIIRWAKKPSCHLHSSHMLNTIHTTEEAE